MIIPLLHKVLLRQDVSEAKQKLDDYKTAAEKLGIVVMSNDSDADALREQSGIDFGTVVTIGPTAYNDYKVECPVAIGDRVVIAKYAGKNIIDPDTQDIMLLVNDEDILAIVKENSDG